MVDFRVPDVDEMVRDELRKELYRFPYLQDRNRNENGVNELIGKLFDSRSSIALEYSDGYVIFRNIRDSTADLFWIHFNGRRFGHSMIRAGIKFFDLALDAMKLKSITLKTASTVAAGYARLMGFKEDRVDEDGFLWHGNGLPMYHLKKEKSNGR